MANYPLLRRPNNLPAVGVLQKLLNSHGGARLKVDGSFGHRTEQAVKEFQRSRHLTPDGIVGVNTWPRVSAGENLPIVDCVDVFDPLLVEDTENPLRKVGGNPLVIGGMCNGVEQAVQMIVGAAPRNVFLLRFHGHGAPGAAGISFGKADVDLAWDQRADIDTGNLDDVLALLMPLKGIFGRYGCIQFMHCETGRGPQGRDLLTRIANTVGVPVSAAVNDQAGLNFGPLPFGLAGPTVTVVPGGKTLASWSANLPEFAGMTVP